MRQLVVGCSRYAHSQATTITLNQENWTSRFREGPLSLAEIRPVKAEHLNKIKL